MTPASSLIMAVFLLMYTEKGSSHFPQCVQLLYGVAGATDWKDTMASCVSEEAYLHPYRLVDVVKWRAGLTGSWEMEKTKGEHLSKKNYLDDDYKGI